MKSKAVDTMCLGYNTNRPSKVHYLPPSFRFPPLREGNRVGRVGSVPPACRGNLKEGVIGHTRFCELWLRDWYYFRRRRSASRLTSPLPNASMLAGSGTTS